MLAKFKRLGSTACRIQITIDLQELDIAKQLDDINLVCIEFERKTKSICSQSKIWSGSKAARSIVFDEALTLLITLYKDSAGIFLEKNGNLVLKGYSEKTASSIKLGSVPLKLSVLAADYSAQKLLLKLVDDKGRPVGTLNLTVTAKFLRDVAAGDDESSVGSFTSELRSLSVPVTERLSHGVLYKESSPSKMYALDVSSAETDRYRRSLRPSASRGASFTVGTKDIDGCERDDSVDSVMSGDMSPSKHRRDSMMSINTNDISTHQYDEMIEILNKNKQLQVEIDDLTGQLYRAGKKLTTADERIESFQKAEVVSASQIKALKDAVAQSDARYSDKDARITKLTEEKRDLKLELSKEQQNTTSLTNAIAGLRKDVHMAQCESAAVQAAVLTIEMQKLQSSMVKMKEQAAVSLTDRSILLSELESTKTLLLESEEKVLSIRNDKKLIEMTAEKQKLSDEKALTEKKLKALEDIVQDYEVEKKMVDRKEVDATKVAVESAQRYDTMVSKMQAKNEKITTELNKWKARYDESSTKHQAVKEAGQKSETANKEAIINLQLELEESLNQLATAWETTGEQSKSMEQSAKKMKALEGKLLELQGELDAAKKATADRTAEAKAEMDVFKLVCDTERTSLTEKIEELTASNADLEQMSSELQVEVEMLSSQSSDKSKSDLNEREKIKSELADVRKSLSTSEALSETLQSQVIASSASYKESQALVASLKAEVAQTKLDLAASQEALNSLEADIEKTMTDWTEKEEAMEEHQKSLTEKITELEEKEIFSLKLVADLDARLKTKTEDFEGLRKVGEGLKKELSDHKGKIERREKTISSLKGSQSVEMEKMVKEMDELKNNASDQEVEMARRNKAIETLKAELAEQLAESEKRGKEVKTLKSELLDQVAEIEKKVKEIESAKEELSDKMLEIEKRDKTIETLRTDIAEHHTEIKKREKGIESLRGDQTAEVEKMAKALQALKEDLEDKVEEIEKRDKLLKTSKDEVLDQVAENEKRSKAIKVLRGELSDQAALTEKKEKEVEVLRGELSDQAIEIERRGREIKGLRSELADQKAAQDKRGKENESLSSELADQAIETEKRDKIIESLRGDQTIEMEKTLKAMQALKEELASHVVEIEKHSRESKGLRISLTDQKSETEKRDKIIEALRGDQTVEMEKMVKEMGVTKSAQDVEVQKMAKEIADSKAELSLKAAEVVKLDNIIEALKAEVADYIEEAEKRAEEIKSLRSDLADQVDETEMRVRDVEVITEELAEQVTETVKRDEIIQSLKGDTSGEVERIQGEMAALRAAQAEQAIESAKQMSTIAELKSELAGKVTKTEKLLEEMEIMKEDLADQVTEVENIGMVVDALKEELTDQAEKVQSLQNDIEDYKSEMEEKAGEMEKMEKALEAMKAENALLTKQLEEKGTIVSTGGEDTRMVLSEKETSYKNQLRMMMFEKKKVELELEKSQESGYALDLVSKQNISAITAEKDRLEMMIKKLKSQLTQSMDKANENIASFSAERQKLKADLVKIQRDADLVEVTAKTSVDEMTAEKEKMYVEWLDKTGKFDILAAAAKDAKASYTAVLKKNEILQEDLVAMSRKAEDLANDLENAEIQAAERELALTSSVEVLTAKIDCMQKLLEENQVQKAVNSAALSEEISALHRRIEDVEAQLNDEQLKHGALQLLHIKMCKDRCNLEDQICGLSSREEKLAADLKSSLANTNDLSVNLDNAEQEAIERELALSSSVTVSTSKIDCLEKILEESQAQRALSDSKCLEEYTSLCMQIGVLENEVEESKAAILKLEAHVFILQEEKQEAKELLDEYKQKAAEKEKTVNGQMKVLLFERKNLETELEQSQEHMMEADKASKSNYLAVSDQRDKLEMQLKVSKTQAAAAAEEIKTLKARLDSVTRQAADEKTALVGSHEAKMKSMLEEEERKLEALAEEVSESFLVEIQSLNEELTIVNDNLSSSQSEFEASQLANSALEDELRETESFGEQERHRHENQIIQLLKIVGIYDSSVDPLDESWVHLFRIQMDEERIKIMTLKNCLMRFTNKLTTVDNGLLRGAGIILVGNVPDT